MTAALRLSNRSSSSCTKWRTSTGIVACIHGSTKGLPSSYPSFTAENVTGIALIDLLTTEFLSDFNCDGVNNLKSLEALTGSQSVDCAYDLGLLFFLDLHHVLGAEDFQRGFQGLYLANEDVLEHDGASVRGVRHVREAFKFSTIATEVVIPRWLEVQGTSQD